MLDLLLFLLTAWAATAAGRTLLRGLRLPDDATVLERNLLGYALGLGLLAYGMLVLGLAHGLYPAAGYGLLLALAALGVGQFGTMARELRVAVKGGLRLSPLGWGTAVLFTVFAALSLLGVWTPPTLAREWDSLSYHLADPKLYLQAHRIYPLPWESHSNFAFTAEMWYTYGMTVGGVPLAKLFHFSCGVGACLGTYAFGARFLSPRVGLLAAGLLASTPLVGWEAGVAYADLAPTFFGTLTLLAVGAGVTRRDDKWLTVGAVLMGLTLSTKATSLVTLTPARPGSARLAARAAQTAAAQGRRCARPLVRAGPGRRFPLVRQVCGQHGQPDLPVLLPRLRRARLQRRSRAALRQR